MVKESDYVRWGNTRRVTSLRKVDQDALWEGVVQGGLRSMFRACSQLSVNSFSIFLKAILTGTGAWQQN